MLSPEVIARFWAKVEIQGECWVWPWHDREGYGWFSLGGPVKAYHVAWYLTYGEWPPDGVNVCHTCDNRACVRVYHLFLGTQQANVDDMWAKGRATEEGVRGNACLAVEEVLEIRIRYAAGGITYKALAAMYGVHRVTIALVVRRKTWDHI